MKIDLAKLANASKLLFSIPLKPLQGSRFQPTGFPGLGAATFQTAGNVNLLVESHQSMANRLESVAWDEVVKAPKADLAGLSYVRVERQKKYLTSSMTEAHRLNSPYILNGSDRTFFDEFLNRLKEELGSALISDNEGNVNHHKLCKVVFEFDVSSLIHGLFLSNKVSHAPKKKPESISGGRLRIARALSAFIEASGVKQAISGGVKNDQVNPSGSTKEGFGNVPFSREEYTADSITLFVNLDLAQIRGYGLDEKATQMLILLALYKIRALVDGDLRLRTACDFEVVSSEIKASKPTDFVLPTLSVIVAELKAAIAACKDQMKVTTVAFNDELKKGSDKEEKSASDEQDGND